MEGKGLDRGASGVTYTHPRVGWKKCFSEKMRGVLVEEKGLVRVRIRPQFRPEKQRRGAKTRFSGHIPFMSPILMVKSLRNNVIGELKLFQSSE